MEKPLCLFCLLAPLLSGCSAASALFGVDPVTGGVDADSSQLAEISLPSGLQRYPGHGFVSMAANGNREGLETLRGHVNAQATASQFYHNLRENGWQLLASQQKESRGMHLYGKGDEYLTLIERPQGGLVIVELWRSGKADPDAIPFGDNAEVSIAPDEYGPLLEKEKATETPAPETWGGKIEEREL